MMMFLSGMFLKNDTAVRSVLSALYTFPAGATAADQTGEMQGNVCEVFKGNSAFTVSHFNVVHSVCTLLGWLVYRSMWQQLNA